MVTWTRAARAAQAYHGTAWEGLDELARRWEIGRMIAALAAADGVAPVLSPVDRGRGGSGEARDGAGVDTLPNIPAAGDVFHHPVRAQ